MGSNNTNQLLYQPEWHPLWPDPILLPIDPTLCYCPVCDGTGRVCRVGSMVCRCGWQGRKRTDWFKRCRYLVICSMCRGGGLLYTPTDILLENELNYGTLTDILLTN